MKNVWRDVTHSAFSEISNKRRSVLVGTPFSVEYFPRAKEWRVIRRVELKRGHQLFEYREIRGRRADMESAMALAEAIASLGS